MIRRTSFIFIVLFLLSVSISFAEANTAKKQAESLDAKGCAGEFFGVKVPMENYYFVKSVIALFGNKWGEQPKTTQQLQNAIWDQLLLSFIAFSQNITVTQEEFDAEISKSLAAENVKFDWKKDKQAYEKWVKNKTNEPTVLFENQIKHLIQLDKLRNYVMDNIKSEVEDKEAYQKFLNEHNSLSLELVEFSQLRDAEDFFKQASGRSSFWDKQKKRRPKDFKRPGFVSLEFLTDIWRIPSDALYKMMQREPGEIYPPRPIYKGYGVFKILEKKQADESQYKEAKDPYYEEVRRRKKYDGLNLWFKNLKEQAKIKIYHKEGG